jgi:hypothetical protein
LVAKLISTLYNGDEFFHIGLKCYCYKTGVLNLLVLAYPQIMLNCLRVPLNKNLTQIVPLNEEMANLGTKKTRMDYFPVDLKGVNFLQSARVPL